MNGWMEGPAGRQTDKWMRRVSWKDSQLDGGMDR